MSAWTCGRAHRCRLRSAIRSNSQRGAAGRARCRSVGVDASCRRRAAHGCRPAGGGPHPGQSGDQAAALPGGDRRPIVAASDPAVVWPRGPYAHSLPLPGRSADCVQAAPPPPGDGCDGTLQWWFDQLNVPARPGRRIRRRRHLPHACRSSMARTDLRAGPNPVDRNPNNSSAFRLADGTN